MKVELTKSEIANRKLLAAMKAINTGCMPDGSDFVPDFSNKAQWKYTPWIWFVPSLGRFVCSRTDITGTRTYLGARFWFATRSTAEKFAEENIDLINDLHSQD